MRVIIQILTIAATAICAASSSYGQHTVPDAGFDAMPSLTIDGTLHIMLDDADTALANLEQRIQTYRSKRKPTDEDKAEYSSVCNNIANHYHHNGRLDIAEQFYDTAYRIRKELAEKSDHYRTLWANILNNYGLYYMDANDNDLAIYYINKALETRLSLRDSLDTHSPEANLVANNYDNLAYSLYKAHFVKDAAENYEKSRAIRRQLVLESGQPELYIDNYITTMQNLAALYKQNNQAIDALAVMIELRETLTQLHANSPTKYLDQIANTKHNTALLYGMLNQKSQAADAMNLAIKDYNVLALSDRNKYLPEVASALNQAANYYADLGDYDNAEKYYKKALDINTKLYTEQLIDATEIAGNFNNLGRLYYDQSKMNEAKECYIKAKEIFDAADPTDIKAVLNKAMTNINIVMYYIYEKNSGIDSEEYHNCAKYLKETIESLRAFLFNPSASYYNDYAQKLLRTITN